VLPEFVRRGIADIVYSQRWSGSVCRGIFQRDQGTFTKEVWQEKRREARTKARGIKIRGRAARVDEAVSSKEETEGRLAQIGFDDWLDRG